MNAAAADGQGTQGTQGTRRDGQTKPARSLYMDSVDDTLNVILLMSV